MEKLAPHLDTLRERFGVEALYLFGSVARGDAGPESDVDFLVRFLRPPGFLGYMGLKLFLEDLLGTRVDLAMDTALRPEVRPWIEKEALKVA